MNERFLCRGKLVATGEWATGYPRPFMSNEILNGLMTRNEYGGWHTVRIDTATIGQCTGLRDRNGTLVFEGDALEWVRPDLRNPEVIRGAVVWKTELWVVKLQEEYRIVDTAGTWCLSAAIDRNAEIIGNIHDKEAATNDK